MPINLLSEKVSNISTTNNVSNKSTNTVSSLSKMIPPVIPPSMQAFSNREIRFPSDSTSKTPSEGRKKDDNAIKGTVEYTRGQLPIVPKVTQNSQVTDLPQVNAVPYRGVAAQLEQQQMLENAQYIYDQLSDDEKYNWSDNAIFGLLGNMYEESGGLNPGQWQKGKNAKEGTAERTTNIGYGLVQWSPADKIINWMKEEMQVDSLTPADLDAMALNDPKKLIDLQLKYLHESSTKEKEKESEPGQEWIKTSNGMSYTDFISNNEKTPGEMASIFRTDYERTSYAAEARETYAEAFSTYFNDPEKNVPVELLNKVKASSPETETLKAASQ